jgi:hypothetical protein
MRSRILVAVVLTLLTAVALSAPAIAGHRAKTTVTIKYNGDGFQGRVKSPRTRCIKNRTVKVYRQLGRTQQPSSDQKLFTDTSDSTGHWDTGTSGQAHGKFYARAKRTTRCRTGTSDTIRATQPLY